MYAEPGKGAIHGAKDLRHGDVYLRLGLVGPGVSANAIAINKDVGVAHEDACAFYLFIRVMEITDILSQNVPLEDVQYLAGHSNPSGHTDL